MPHLEPKVANKISQLSEERSSVTVKSDNIQADSVPIESLEIGLLFGLPILLFLLLKLFKLPREEGRGNGGEKTTDLCKAAPCSSCRFFSSNVYLKCAVRPSDALTDRAVDCPDYCPRHR